VRATPATEKGTISISFVEPVRRALQDRGLDAGAILEQAGLSLRLLPQAQARVSPSVYARLMRLAAQALDDEFFGQDSRRMKVGSFAMLCRTVIHDRTLEEALNRILSFFGLLLDDLHGTLSREGDIARITLHPRDKVAIFAQETLLVFVHRLACWLINRRIAIRHATFCYPEPAHGGEYRLLFTHHLAFAQPLTALTFDAATLDRPVVRDGIALNDFLRIVPENLLVQYRDHNGQSARIRARLRGLAPSDWPSFEVLARTIHLSVPTLRRRLEAEGQSYRLIKDQLRRDLAITGLGTAGKSVTTIATELGFAEPSAFHRAFKKWTGVGPGEYRRSLAQGSDR
jgi:AraC-like DNA-binding protein